MITTPQFNSGKHKGRRNNNCLQADGDGPKFVRAHENHAHGLQHNPNNDAIREGLSDILPSTTDQVYDRGQAAPTWGLGYQSNNTRDQNNDTPHSAQQTTHSTTNLGFDHADAVNLHELQPDDDDYAGNDMPFPTPLLLASLRPLLPLSQCI